MRLYKEKIGLGHHSNINFYTATEAFFAMGFEVIEVENLQDVEIKKDHVFVGSIRYMHKTLQKLNIPIPKPFDYPESLRSFLGREVWVSGINDIANNPENWNVFVKPKNISKKFTGRLITSTKDLIGCGDLNENTSIWVSEPKIFLAEWRVFIRYGRVVGVKIYKGDWRMKFDYKVVEKAVKQFQDAPAGYALDFGYTDQDKTLLIEANDGYSLGSYGLFYIDYAKLLSARWSELTGQKDLCDF